MNTKTIMDKNKKEIKEDQLKQKKEATNVDSDKVCSVPKCPNNYNTTPKKHFVPVPAQLNIRKKWFNAMQCDGKYEGRKFYCCEDHFDLEKDLTNYMQYKVMGQLGFSRKFVLKDNVVPSVFNCLLPDKLQLKMYEALLKRQQLVQDAMNEYDMKYGPKETVAYKRVRKVKISKKKLMQHDPNDDYIEIPVYSETNTSISDKGSESKRKRLETGQKRPKKGRNRPKTGRNRPKKRQNRPDTGQNRPEVGQSPKTSKKGQCVSYPCSIKQEFDIVLDEMPIKRGPETCDEGHETCDEETESCDEGTESCDADPETNDQEPEVYHEETVESILCTVKEEINDNEDQIDNTLEIDGIYQENDEMPIERGLELCDEGPETSDQGPVVYYEQPVENDEMLIENVNPENYEEMLNIDPLNIKHELSDDHDFEVFGKLVASELKNMPQEDALECQAYIKNYLIEKKLTVQ